MSNLTQSILLTGPSGVGKSTFARSALEAEGSGIVAAVPGFDELDTYYGLTAPSYNLMGFDDLEYLPSLGKTQPNGLRDLVRWLYERLGEVAEDVKDKKEPRYKVVVVDTISAAGGILAYNATLAKFNRSEPPPALSPDGASFYTYLKSRQEELMRVVRAFRGYGCHVIVLSHIGEGEVSDANTAKENEGKLKMYTPLVPGAFKLVLPSYFSTVLSAGVVKTPEGRKHYVQWAPDGKRLVKNRFGGLGPDARLPNDWTVVKQAVEQAAVALTKRA